MRTSEDIKIVQAKAPSAVTAAATTYNGAAVADAVGIDVRGKSMLLAALSLGAIGASSTGVAYSFAASAASSNPASDIEVVTDSATTVLPANANSVVAMSVATARLPNDKPYLYVKRVQGSTDSVVDGINVILTDGNQQPADQTFAVNLK
jgi:hypothetical protein